MLFSSITISHAQSIDTEYGKNRIQYHDDFSKWWMYETENFITYWYGKGRNIGQATVQIAEYYHDDIQDLVEHRINDKIEIIVYTDISDLIQSNFGSEEVFETNAGEPKVIGSKMFIYFDGSHQNLRAQIREGIAQVFINSMYSKTSLQEIITSNADLIIPDWFGKGFTNYANSGWDNQIDDELREIWFRDKTKLTKFKRLLSTNPRLAGHSFWHFLYSTYGQNTTTNLMYLLRLSGDLNDSFEFVLASDFKGLQREWASFFTSKYEEEKPNLNSISDSTMLNLGYKNFFPKSAFKLSPNGRTLAYAINNIGKYDLVIQDLQDRSNKRVIMRKGHKNAVQETDYNYPLISWKDEKTLAVVFEERGKIYLRIYETDSKNFAEQLIPENVQRVFSIDWLDDENFIFTALVNGYSDIIEYDSKYRRSKNITEDYHDDLYASFTTLGNQKGILFSSNRESGIIEKQRLETDLPLRDFDIFFLPYIDGKWGSKAINISSNYTGNNLHPLIANEKYIVFLNENNGLLNRTIIDIQTNRTYVSSNYEHNIINHEATRSSDLYIYQVYHDEAYQLHIESPEWNQSTTPYNLNNATLLEENAEEKETKEDDAPLFISRFPDPEKIEPLNVEALSAPAIDKRITEPVDPEKVIKFYTSRAVASRRQFKLETIDLRADNEVLFEGLESYTDDREFDGQNPGILLKGITKDLFEDIKITAGIRIPTTLKGSEIFVTYDDDRKLIDRRYAIYRKSVKENIPFTTSPQQKEKFTSLLGLYQLSYPFSTYRSVRATTQLRIDKRFNLNSDFPSSTAPVNKEQRLSLKLEYVFDNTLPVDINIQHGSKYKAYLEVINRFDLSVDDGFNFEFSRGFTSILGFDARHYQPILRNSLIAVRAAGATSFGNSRMLYFIGGTDGSLSQASNQDIPIPSDRSFSFMAHAPHLRGFDRNIRNGNTFAIINSEIRVPIFKYLSKRELKSKFLRNVQAIAFFDFGSAWYGTFPGGQDNPINTLTINDTPGVIIRVDVDRKPWVYGYGIGGRINLFGYYMRLDYAYGNERGFVGNPKLHFSIGQDF